VNSSSSEPRDTEPTPNWWRQSDRSGFDYDRCKLFFNYMEFTEKELENMLEDPQGDGDAWVSVEVVRDFAQFFG
jgi:hypothetical protein